MEDAALTPPPRLEKLVLALIPPCAREAVAGDLCETYRAPRQYAVEALRTVPFVIASQARRNLNLPVLAVQGALLFFLMNAFAPRLAPVLAPPLLLALVLRGAYQPLSRPQAHSAIRDCALVGMAMVLVLETLSLGVAVSWGAPDRDSWLTLFWFGPMLVPLLCVLRTGLVLDGDQDTPCYGDLGADALAERYLGFLRSVRRRALLEAAGTLALAALLLRLAMPALAGVTVLAAVYLVLPGMAETLPVQADLLSIQAFYKRALARRGQQSRLLRWLWLTPVVVALHRLIQTGLQSSHPVMAVAGGVAMVIACFLVTALNREFGSRAQEKITALERMRPEMTA